MPDMLSRGGKLISSCPWRAAVMSKTSRIMAQMDPSESDRRIPLVYGHPSESRG